MKRARRPADGLLSTSAACPDGAFAVDITRSAWLISGVFSKPRRFVRSAALHLAILMVIVAVALTTAAQTNPFPQSLRWLVLPDPHLRTESTEPVMIKSDAQKQPADSNSILAELSRADLKIQHAEPITLRVDQRDQDFQQYRRRWRNFGFIRPAPAPDGILSRSLDSVFRPEEFKVGRTATVSCSILTAIKRKNPLCLLNPIFLKMSW